MKFSMNAASGFSLCLPRFFALHLARLRTYSRSPIHWICSGFKYDNSRLSSSAHVDNVFNRLHWQDLTLPRQISFRKIHRGSWTTHKQLAHVKHIYGYKGRLEVRRQMLTRKSFHYKSGDPKKSKIMAQHYQRTMIEFWRCKKFICG